MSDRIPSFLLSPEPRLQPYSNWKSKRRLPFIDRTLKKLSGFIQTGYQQMETARIHGLLQGIDSRIKMIFLICFVIQANALKYIPAQVWLFIFLLIISSGSRLNLFQLYKKVLLFSFFFGFLVIAPASVNLITHGRIVFTIIHLGSPKQLWIYHIPSEIGFTYEGLMLVARLYMKVFNSITITLLIFSTTPFDETIKALKIFRVPDIFLLILTMTYKFVFILAQTILETYFALKLRWWSKLKRSETNRIVASRVNYTFRKAWHKYDEVFRAMVARGFTGKVTLHNVNTIALADVCFLAIFLIVSFTLYQI